MLTMKYKARLDGESVREFSRAIGSYAFTQTGDYVQFLAFDNERGDGTPDVWSGWKTTPQADMVPVSIFVMNDAGATVAVYHYNDNRPEPDPQSLPVAA